MLQGLSSSAGGMPGGLGMESGKSRSLEGKEKESSFSQLLSQKAPKERKETKSPTTDANDRSAKAQSKAENTNKAETTTSKSGEAKREEGPSSETAENTQTKAEKAEGKTAKGKKAEGQQKQKAMQKFMDSIESEFGIPPTRIVEAMANLSETQLQMPPEDTASAVVAQFNLNPAQTQKAESMYLKMLADTQSPVSTGENKGGMLIPEFFTPVTPESSKAEMMAGGLGGAALLARMTAADRRQHVNAGLDAMNNKFFVNPLTQQKAAGLETQALTNPESMMGIGNLEAGQSAVPQLPIDKFESLPQVDPGSIMPPEALPVQTPGLTSTDDLAAALQALDRAAMNLAPKAAGEEVVLSAGKDLAGLGLGAASLAVGADAVSAAEDKQQDFSDSAKQDSSNQEFFLNKEAQGLNGKLQKSALGAGVIGAGAGQTFNLNNVSREQRAENIQRIMDKANVIAQKGGGSMRVQMTPEGLGTIDLKVTIVNGKMDMQLKTETNEAKQLLENSLGELKHSLASQKLSLENVKVDVGLDSRDNGQSMSQHQRHPGSDDASREAARQFLGQFRQQNSEGRSGFLEAPGMKAYAPKKKEDLAPITEAQVRRTAEHKGNGVNLVA